ncbi:MAG: hypothetical protein WBE80_11925 [Methylocella sp.]
MASVALGALLFWGGMVFQNWLSPAGITVNGTKVELRPRKRTGAPVAAPVPTKVRILFGPISVPPKEMFSQNVEWQAIEGTGYQQKYNGFSPDPDETICRFSLSDKCFLEYKYLDLVLSFEKPITFKNIKVTMVQGGVTPYFDKAIMTETDAILSFSSYPTNKLLDIEATD